MKQPQYATLRVSIKGLTDGKYPIDLAAEAEKIEYMLPEFRGMLTIQGTLRKHGKRYLLDIQASVPAHLVCDLSGEEYEEIVAAECKLEYISDTHLALLKADDAEAEPPYYIRDDDTSIDITDEIRQELGVMMPLKNVSPKYRGKEFTDIFPAFAGEQGNSASAKKEEAPLDPRWAALQSIKFEK